MLSVAPPKKQHFRQRAHCNPLSDSHIPHPNSPDEVDWSLHYPSFFNKTDQQQEQQATPVNTLASPITYGPNEHSSPAPSILDIGCGYGALIIGLGEMFPDKLILGMEIRDKVTQFTGALIDSNRANKKTSNNVSVVRTNAMKYLPNYFRSNTLELIFICFPDPHFKKSNHRRRIITRGLLTLYAHLLKDNGKIYFISDVKELYEWVCEAGKGHPLFKLEENDCCDDSDPIIRAMRDTNEGQKVRRNGGTTYCCIFSR